MTSLEKTVEITKKVLIGFAIGIGSIIFLVILVNILGSLKKALFPNSVTSSPTVSFGKLPSIKFDNNSKQGNFSYNLETISGALPNLPSLVKVFKIDNPSPNLLNLTNVENQLANSGFSSSPKSLSDVDYEWNNNSTPSSTIIINIINNNFNYAYDFQSDPSVLQGVNLPDSTTAISTAINFFNSFGNNLPTDININNPSISYFSINNGIFTPAASLSQAQALRLDFTINKVNNLQVFYPSYPNSLMYAYVGGGENSSQVLEAKYFHVNITNNFSTYPIISAKEAFNDLKNGSGYISPSYSGGRNVTIRNIVLGYLITSDTQNYLMPVIVFIGDNNFYGFVSAVNSSWIQ